MKYRSEAALRDGATAVLRSLCVQDAPEALYVMKKTADETRNLVRYADEWTLTVDDERAYIRRQQDDPRALLLGAFVEDRLVGVAGLTPAAPVCRARHRASLGVVVLQAAWGRGVGTAMLRALIGQARATACEQLELEAVGSNERAIRLYTHLGFVPFGRHPRKFKHRDGTYDDAVLMMLDLRGQG